MSDSQRKKALMESVPTGLFTNGERRASADGSSFAVEDPATELVLTRAANAQPIDGLEALDAAV
jgi:succinate-semialdehyde dehydrogenase/glutarate-semialdehyde dehydrogenase